MAQITITSSLPRRRLPEGSAASFTANVYDDSWDLSAPSTAKYRVDNPQTGENLTDWTTLSPASSMAISLDGSAQLLRDQCNDEELRRLTVVTNAGLSTQASKSFNWWITNSLGVS